MTRHAEQEVLPKHGWAAKKAECAEKNPGSSLRLCGEIPLVAAKPRCVVTRGIGWRFGLRGHSQTRLPAAARFKTNGRTAVTPISKSNRLPGTRNGFEVRPFRLHGQ